MRGLLLATAAAVLLFGAVQGADAGGGGSRASGSGVTRTPAATPIAGCTGRTMMVTGGPAGRQVTVKVCLDGKYSSCMRDMPKFGWDYAFTKNYCDNKLASGRLTSN
jgi:hypothetical protein